ncbi:NAD(P)H-flavin reductase [Glaciecola sp. SC05]|uniref:NAD(P)H-flavin reductase n=1 Tax=Glaciecola sp. SC05 TaxID=1987355 RepID=UPI003528D2F2
MTLTKANLVSKESLTPYVYKVILKPEKKVSFKAGQYLQVVMGDKDKRPFSIANMPANSDYIELHIGATPESPYAYEVMQRLDEQQFLVLEVALGNAYIQDSSLDAILIAGGTGYSYAKSILLDMLQNQANRNVTLYWGAKHLEDLYEAEALIQLSQQHAKFTFIPVVEVAADGWQGKVGFVHHAVMQDVTNFSDKQVYVAGRFEMAKVVKDDFLPLGLLPENLVGDAFAFI